MSAKLSINAGAQVVALTVAEGLIGVPSRNIVLADATERWKVSVPREAYAGMIAEPGDVICVAISLIRASVTEVTDEPDKPRVIMPRGLN